MSSMLQRNSEPPPGLSQSQWWARLASFSAETRNTPELSSGETDGDALTYRESSATKRGLRRRVRWPLSLRSITKVVFYLKLEWLLQYSSRLFQKRTNS